MWNKNSLMYLQLDLGIPLLTLSAACALGTETKQCHIRHMLYYVFGIA